MDERSIKRFWAKVSVGGPDECWLWTASVNHKGYGQFRQAAGDKGLTTAHRFSYFLATGVIPNICRHTCDNPPCVNPAHLLDGTTRDNKWDSVTRGRTGNHQSDKTHCPRGHPLSGENLYVRHQRRANVVTGQRGLQRECRECHRESDRRYRARCRMSG